MQTYTAGPKTVQAAPIRESLTVSDDWALSLEPDGAVVTIDGVTGVAMMRDRQAGNPMGYLVVDAEGKQSYADKAGFESTYTVSTP